MSLDEEKIWRVTQKILNRELTDDALKPLLGGKKLNEIFDLQTQQVIFHTIVTKGKIHNMINDGTGFYLLDGLINNQICGDLSDFYMIKPDYILSLPEEQQKNMADSISNGREDLCLTLLNLWSKGIKTEACTTKDSDNIPMLQLIVKENEIEKQKMIQQIYEQNNIRGDAFYNYIDKTFKVTISGSNLYNYLKDGEIPQSTQTKSNIFLESVKGNIDYTEKLYNYFLKKEYNTNELKKQLVLEKATFEDIKGRVKQIDDEETEDSLKQNQEKSSEKKPWELEPEEKLKLQIKNAELAKRERDFSNRALSQNTKSEKDNKTIEK